MNYPEKNMETTLINHENRYKQRKTMKLGHLPTLPHSRYGAQLGHNPWSPHSGF